MHRTRFNRIAVILLLAIAPAIVLVTSLPVAAQRAPQVGQPAPEIMGAPWINSEPLSMEKLRGRVVFVEFWTYG